MCVTRTPLTLRSITSATLHVPSSAWNRRVESSKGVSTSSRDVSRSGPEIPAVSTRQSIPRGQELEQFARAQGRAAGGVQVTMDRGEEQVHGIPARKVAMRAIDGIGSGKTSPLRSRSCHQKETTCQRRSQDSGIPVVSSVGRDRAEGLCQPPGHVPPREVGGTPVNPNRRIKRPRGATEPRFAGRVSLDSSRACS